MTIFVERQFEIMDLRAVGHRQDEVEAKLVGSYRKVHDLSEVPSSCQSRMPNQSIQCASFNLKASHALRMFCCSHPLLMNRLGVHVKLFMELDRIKYRCLQDIINGCQHCRLIHPGFFKCERGRPAKYKFLFLLRHCNEL